MPRNARLRRMSFWEPLIVVAARGGRVDDVAALLTDGANVDASDDDGCTALWHACSLGHAQVV